MISNFGWDFIYRDWGGDFVDIADWISECYSKCDRLFRLPFHEPMQAFNNIENITDIGLTGGYPFVDADEIKSKWNINTPREKTVLLTFGGLGLQQIPYQNLNNYPDWQFITFDKAAPDLPNLIKIEDKRIRPVDFMPICGRVVSKPGFGTFAEATKLGVPIVSITRENFAESAFLLEGISDYNYHQILTPAELFESSWEFLKQPLKEPRCQEAIAIDGNEVIAKAVISHH